MNLEGGNGNQLKPKGSSFGTYTLKLTHPDLGVDKRLGWQVLPGLTHPRYEIDQKAFCCKVILKQTQSSWWLDKCREHKPVKLIQGLVWEKVTS